MTTCSSKRLAMMQRHNVIGVLGGAPELVKMWMPAATIRQLHKAGAPDDARLEPLWAMAEELDIPVGIHIGGGEPGTPYTGSPAFRARLQSALTLEEVLVRHPRMRVYIMHAGYPLLDDLLALLFTASSRRATRTESCSAQTRSSGRDSSKPGSVRSMRLRS